MHPPVLRRRGTTEFYAALWIGALRVAGGAAVDAFPDDLHELAAQFFARFRPTTKA